MHWSDSLTTHIWIFSIGRGNAAFVRTGLNQGFVIDMGAGEDFDVAKFVKKNLAPHLSKYGGNFIAQALLSHPHSDHIGQCEELGMQSEGGKIGLYPTLLTCPNDKDPGDGKARNERLNWKRIINPNGSDDLIAGYKALYAKRNLPLQTIQFDSKRTIPNLEYGVYYIRPPFSEQLHPKNDQDYGNSTSLMFYMRHGKHSILFPGDMTPDGMAYILSDGKGVEKRYTVFDRNFTEQHPTWHCETDSQPSLKYLLGACGLTILVAPHHGLESCFSTLLYDNIRGGKPQMVVISEKRHLSEQDGKLDKRYQSEEGAGGLDVEVDGKTEKARRSLLNSKRTPHIDRIQW